MNISYIIKFRVKKDKLSAFSEIMNKVNVELPDVEGCTGVIIHHNSEDLSIFVLVETWQSKAHHENHVQNLINTGAWDIMAAHLSEDPVAGYYNAI